jgi:hypothetical protein
MPARLVGCVAGSSLVLALFSSVATAQTAERPDVKVGDRWQFAVYWATPSTQPSRVREITAITRTGFEGTENGEPLVLSRDLGVLDSPLEKNSNPETLSFPLELGKQWRYSTEWLFKPKNSRGSSVVDVIVVGYEKITVPAGEFDAFKLVASASIRGLSGIGSQIDAETKTTYWYAPAARAVVKSVTHNPYLGTSTVELVGVQLRP